MKFYSSCPFCRRFFEHGGTGPTILLDGSRRYVCGCRPVVSLPAETTTPVPLPKPDPETRGNGEIT